MFDTDVTPVMRGASGSADGGSGKVPKPFIADRFKILRGDGTFVTCALNYTGGVDGASVPATLTTAGDYKLITSAGTSQGKTWAVGDVAVYEGSSGNYTQLAGLNVLPVVAFPANTAASGSAGQIAFSADSFAYYVAGTGWQFIDSYQK